MAYKMMLLAVAAGVVGLATGASAAPIAYAGSQQLGSVLARYSIVTDGSLGDIDYSHISSYSVTLSDSLSTTSYGRTIAGGTGSASGTFLASSTGLTIPLFENLNLYTNATNAAGSYLAQLQFNYNTSYVQISDAAHNNGFILTTAEPNRTVPFATVVAAMASPTPEPATWGMMILGFGIVGGALRRRRVTPRASFAA